MLVVGLAVVPQVELGNLEWLVVGVMGRSLVVGLWLVGEGME